jgi:hypothetical protein
MHGPGTHTTLSVFGESISFYKNLLGSIFRSIGPYNYKKMNRYTN